VQTHSQKRVEQEDRPTVAVLGTPVVVASSRLARRQAVADGSTSRRFVHAIATGTGGGCQAVRIAPTNGVFIGAHRIGAGFTRGKLRIEIKSRTSHWMTALTGLRRNAAGTAFTARYGTGTGTAPGTSTANAACFLAHVERGSQTVGTTETETGTRWGVAGEFGVGPGRWSADVFRVFRRRSYLCGYTKTTIVVIQKGVCKATDEGESCGGDG